MHILSTIFSSYIFQISRAFQICKNIIESKVKYEVKAELWLGAPVKFEFNALQICITFVFATF